MHTRLAQLASRLEECLAADRGRLHARLRAAASDLDDVAAAGPLLDRIEAEMEESALRRRRRREAMPVPVFPEALPVSQRRAEIAAAIAAHQVVVVCGETGSGKTTQLPKICLAAGRGVDGMIAHTQPRRIAARSVAARVAKELGARVGGLVGCAVRFDDRTGPETAIRLMTDGVLLAETQQDRRLMRYDTIIVDEAHERSLNIDFLLGYLRQLLPRRPDLKLIVTSATIDPVRFSDHFGGAPVIEVSGRVFPVEVRWRPGPGDGEEERDLVAAVLDGVEEALAIDRERGGEDRPRDGDILVFLPGEREIVDAAEALRGRLGPSVEIVPLYGRLSSEDQDRVFAPHERRRVVLATNVAETSITVPGIRYVVDSGLARISRFSPRTMVQRLPVEPVSRASADQRAGRCGRVESGVCIRLYDQADYEARPRFTDPEVLRTSLAAVILQMKVLRLGPVERFPFLDPPSSRAVAAGYETLREIGALDAEDGVTRIGREIARYPVDPRLARMIIEAREEGCLAEILVIAAFLAVQDPRLRPADRQAAADLQHARFRDEQSDFLGILRLWDAWTARQQEVAAGTATGSALRRWCRESFLSWLRLREWQDVHEQLVRMAARHADEGAPRRRRGRRASRSGRPFRRAE